MFPTTLYRSYHFADLSSFTLKPPQTPHRQVTSSHIQILPPPRPQTMHHQLSEVFTKCGSITDKEYHIEIRGLNEDNLEQQQVWTWTPFYNYLITLPKFTQINLISDIFKHLKRWFYIYGLVTVKNCLFLLKKRSELYSPKPNQEYFTLIIYLSKKQSASSFLMANHHKELFLIEQFLIMFGNFLLDHSKPHFSSFVVFQEFLQKLKFQNYPSLHSSKFLGSETDFSQKNFSMTTSQLQHSEALAYDGLRPKAVEKSMMIIEEKSSEYSSPKKYITASGFMEKNLSQTELLRPESCLGVRRQNFVQRRNIDFENRMYLTPVKITMSPKPVITPKPMSPISRGQTSAKKRITFNYISPQYQKQSPRLQRLQRLQRPSSIICLKSQQKVPQIQIRPCTPTARQTEQFTFRKSPDNFKQFQRREQRKSISQPNLSSPQDSKSQFRSTSIEKQINNRQTSNLKLTATTLNTYQNTSSNYISLSQHSFHKSNLRISGNSDHFYMFNTNSPKGRNSGRIHFGIKNQDKRQVTNQTTLETRQRKYSQVDNQNKPIPTQKPLQQHKLYGTTHQLNLKPVNIFDVQQVQETNKSDEKFYKISEESNNCTQRNSYQVNDIENELDNLFGESEDSEKNQAEIEQMIEEFENLLFD